MGKAAICCPNVSSQDILHRRCLQGNNFKCQSSNAKERISNAKIQMSKLPIEISEKLAKGVLSAN